MGIYPGKWPLLGPLTEPDEQPQNYLRGVAQAFPRIFTPEEIETLPLDPNLSKGGQTRRSRARF